MKALKIKTIKSKGIKTVYDIHHNLEQNQFSENEPNFISKDGFILSNCGRHAGGVLVTEDLESNMPVIRSKGVLK